MIKLFGNTSIGFLRRASGNLPIIPSSLQQLSGAERS